MGARIPPIRPKRPRGDLRNPYQARAHTGVRLKEASHVEAYCDHVPCRRRIPFYGGGLGVVDAGSRAAEQLSITFGSPPPPPVYEMVPAPRVGYVWAPGHYVLVNDRYVWTRGQWMAARAGYRYVPDTWERTYVSGREQWRHVPSRWDRDGDGIPDRYQRQSERGPWGD